MYILGPTSKELEQFYAKDKLHDGEEMCENILYLGMYILCTCTVACVLIFDLRQRNLHCKGNMA